MHMLKICPLPKMVLKLGFDKLLIECKKVVKGCVGKKRVSQFLEAAKNSIGVDYGVVATYYKIRYMIEDLELMNKQLDNVGLEIEKSLEKTGISKYCLSIKGIGILSLGACLGEIGEPLRFDNARQLWRLAGYNLIENSSGKNKSGTIISKRGRKNLRCILFQMSLVMITVNDEMKQLYNYFTNRDKNPLKKMQAMVVVSKKILTLIFILSKKKEYYDPSLVFGNVRKSQLEVA